MWVEGQSFWYYLITYCFFELVYAMEIIPYETLAAEMSPNYQTKAKFAGARIICGQIANIAAMWLPGVIIAQLGGKESARHVPLPRRDLLGVLRVRGARGVPVHLGAAARGDRQHRAARPTDRRSRNLEQLFEDLWATLRIRAFRLHLGMYLGGYISQDVLNAVLSYIIAFVFLGLGRHGVLDHHLDGDARSCSPWCSRSGSRCAFIAAPSYRIALGLFGLGILGFAALYVTGVRRHLRGILRRRWSSPASAAARSTTFPGASTTTCRTSMKSSRAGGAKARSRAS